MTRQALASAVLLLSLPRLSAQEMQQMSYIYNPSAESYNISRYGNASPDLHTGAMTYSLPVYTYSDPDFTIPVSLDYRYQGYRPSTHSGLVGLGWSLNAGGAITRDVRGFPDDIEDGYVKGYWWYSTSNVSDTTRMGVYSSKHSEAELVFTTETDYRSLLDVYSDIPVYVADSMDFVGGGVSQTRYDTEPDIFHFSFGGISGDFILCKGREPIVFNTNVPPGELKVSFQCSGLSNGIQRYARITITTGDGFAYTFGGRRSACEYSRSLSYDVPTVGNCTATAWKLVSIKTPESGRQVSFQYDSTLFQRTMCVETVYTPKTIYSGTQYIYDETGVQSVQCINSTRQSEKKVFFQYAGGSPLVRIDVSGGTSIQFSYSERDRDETSQFNYNTTLPANVSAYLLGLEAPAAPKSLSGITVRRGDGSIVQQTALSKRYRTTAPYRMFLSSVTGSKDGTFTFSYTGEDDYLPRNDAGGTDYWGFWNGQSKVDFRNRFLEEYWTDGSLYEQFPSTFVLKNPNFSYSSKCALSRIGYPSGGHTEVCYEGNNASRYLSADGHDHPVFMQSSSLLQAGGIRVAKLKDISEVDDFSDSTRFEYGEGALMVMPRMGLQSIYKVDFQYPEGLSNGVYEGHFSVSSTAYADPLGVSVARDGFVSYGKLAKINADGSRTEYDYTGWIDFPDSYQTSTSAITKHLLTVRDYVTPENSLDSEFYEYMLTPPSADRSGFRGKVKEIRKYDADSVLIKRTVNKYGSLYLGNMRQYSNALDHFVKTRRHYAHPVLSSTVETVFEDGDSLSVTDSFDYNELGQVTHRETSTLDRSLGTGRYYTYCHESSGGDLCESPGAMRAIRKTAVRDAVEHLVESKGCSYDPGSKRIAPVSVTDSLTLRTSTFQYDALGHCTSACRNGSRRYTYTWDSAGTHIVRTTGPDSTATSTFTWLDQAGPASITDVSGKTERYTYDSASRLSSVSDGNNRTVRSYTYKTDTVSVATTSGSTIETAPLSGASGVAVNTFTSAAGSSYRDITFCNGLGYPMQTISSDAGGNGCSIVTPIVYDNHRRPDAKRYLSYPEGLSCASPVPDAAGNLDDWYSSEYGSSEVYNFYETVFEDAEDGRPLSVRKPGEVFSRLGKTANISYALNAPSDSVLALKYLPPASDNGEPSFTVAGWTPRSTLRKTAIVDEDGCLSETYTDAFGGTVMTRGRSDSLTRCDTYFIKDYRDSVVCIVQPEGAANLSIGDTVSFDSGFAIKWTSRRKYDVYGNLAASAAPGTGYHMNRFLYNDYGYDSRDRMVSFASPQMKWHNILHHTVYNDRDQIVRQYYTQYNTTRLSVERKYYPADPDSSFVSVVPADLRFISEPGFADASDLDTVHIRTLPAYEIQYCVPMMSSSIASSPEFSRRRAFHYDSKGRVIQAAVSDSDGFALRYSTKYDFLGNVVATKEEHCDPYGVLFYLATFYDRDKRGRILSITREFDEMPLDTLFYEYDDLGRLSYTYVPNDKFERYSHRTLQGWDAGSESYAWNTDLLIESIGYWDSYFLHPQYSGQVAGVDVIGSDGCEKISHYSYDGVGRLVDAASELDCELLNLNTERNIRYDRNGNILSMSRYLGRSYTAPVFPRDGNRLDYNSYDFNGNCKYDYFSDLSFSNNVINLPGTIENDVDEYWVTYLPDGTKTSFADWTGMDNRYSGSFVFNRPQFNTDYDLASISWDEGQVFFEKNQDGTLTRKDALFVRDHLGSVRSILNLSDSASTSPSVKELCKADYLPFGMRATGGIYYSQKSYAPNRWHFEGKENLAGGLYDSGARTYNPITGTWLQPDPEAFSYPSLSPYSFCAGNPVRFVDPEGKTLKILGKNNTDFEDRVLWNLEWLEKNGLDQYINQLELSDVTYFIALGPKNRFHGDERTIYFNPYQIYMHEDRFCSPAVMLNHELHHACFYDDIKMFGTNYINKHYTLLKENKTLSKYENSEDAFIILTSEFITAQILGEIPVTFGPRKDHNTLIKAIPTSKTPEDISKHVSILNKMILPKVDYKPATTL